jgi:predicted alpha-1,2-mannosidase
MINKRFNAFAAGLLLCLAVQQTNGQEKSCLDYIDPFIGNVAPLLNSNRPVVQLPNQMVRVFPRRQDQLDMQITDFPMLATNIITPQTVFGIKPSTGEVTDTGWYRRLTYDHDYEVAKPWYYSVLLTDEGIRTEYTAGARTGIYRFRFPAGVRKNLLLSHYYAGGEYGLEQGHVVTGVEQVDDAIHAQRGVAYLYGVFSGSPETGARDGDKDWGKYSVQGAVPKTGYMKGKRVWASYGGKDAAVVEFRYGVSFVSIEQAKNNYDHEVAGVSFEQLEERGKAAWAKVINQIRVEGGSEAQRRSFYTALYRCYARMVDLSEDGSYFSGYDKKVHRESRDFYTDDYSWGNYLALHPLRTILDPAREADMLQSYVRMYEQEGWMPEYPRHFGDRPGMFAFHSSVMFLDAYRKGVRNFDVAKALEGNIKNEEQATLLPSRNGPKGPLEDFYYEHGYYPALHPGEAETDPFALAKRGQKRSAVAVTLGDSYDSWAVSELADELHKADIRDRFAPRAKNYRNLWWDKAGMFMPKDASGNWIDIDPGFDGGHAGLDYYNENNGYSYLWYVQHDLRGLRQLMGGPEQMEAKLDQMFTEGVGRSKPEFWEKFPDQTGMIGRHSMGNQVTFFIPYVYNYTNAPWKTQKYTRLILDTWFRDDVFGVPGDEDGGSMSSFVVFSAMGFFPLTPGIPKYAITSPLFSKVTIALPNGKKFTLIANKCSKTNKYIQSASLNGKPLKSLLFSHEDLIKGGTLVLEMGESTNTKWEMYE